MVDISQEDVDAFNGELQELLDKYNFALAAEAHIIEGKIVAKAVVAPNKSNKVKDEKSK